MSEQIDWSKAPADATHHCAETDTEHECWLKPGHVVRVSRGTSEWVSTLYVEEFIASLKSTPRPSTTSWSGEGLPPVGVVCEMHHESWQPNNWPKVTVRYASAEYFITTDDAGEQHWHAHSVKFRPIRTPEQIARDERDESVISVFRLIKENGWDIQSDDAYYLYFLYDSGLLKKAS